MAVRVNRQRVLVGLGAAAIAAVAARRRRATRYSFRGRIVLLTGGTRGLGLALARRLVAEDARVWLVARSEDELQSAATELEQHGGRVRTIRADIRSAEAAARIVEQVVEEVGRIDVLVNNAGVITVAPFEHTHVEDIEESMAVHFWGPLHLIRAALPFLTCDGTGRIVNIASIGGRVAVPHLSAYAAGKFALVGLSETLRAELKRDGVLVTTVTPGLMRTGSYVNARVRGQHEEEARWFSLSSATALSAQSAARAARQILSAVRTGRATCTPGVRARLAHVASAVAPELTAAAATFAAAHVLPPPTSAAEAETARTVADVDQGWTRALLPSRTRRFYHQPEPASTRAPLALRRSSTRDAPRTSDDSR